MNGITVLLAAALTCPIDPVEGEAGPNLALTRTATGNGTVLVGLKGGRPDDVAFLLIGANPLEMSATSLRAGSDAEIAFLGLFDSGGTASLDVALPMFSSLHVRGLAASHERASLSSTAAQPVLGGPISARPMAERDRDDQIFRTLRNIGIDDPNCSETIFGHRNVGMLIPDHFYATGWYTLMPGTTYFETEDGEAFIMAEVRERFDPDRGFIVNIGLSGRADPGDANYPCDGTPYYRWGPLANANPSCSGLIELIDPESNWHCFEETIGLLIGIDEYSGALGVLTENSAAFQVGRAANDKNLADGLAGWWDVEWIQHPTEGPPFPLWFDEHGEFRLVEVFGDF